ncbi:MAG: hypothetical protein IJ046_04585 [Clostridia bacterium]|nr:hypothetical protein [Clostridia bacterium]
MEMTDAERRLALRARELFERSDDVMTYSDYLTPREQRIVFDELRGDGGRLLFFGGCMGCERRRAVFLPLWLCAEGTDAPLFSKEREEHFLASLSSFGMEEELALLFSPLKISGSGYRELSHRDFLGSLTGLGIKRSVLGDIIVKGNHATVFCDERTVDFIISELSRAGRDKVRCERAKVDPWDFFERSFQEITQTVASPRLDGIVRALLSVSRDEAAAMVSRGECEINYQIEKEPDRTVEKGDIVTVRGRGKFIIDSAEDTTRRGRIRVQARKYI